MASTPAGEPAHRRRHRLGDHSGTRTRSPRRRHPTGTRMARRRRAFATRPTTLWPLADAEPLPGTARLTGWLGRTVLTLVTSYTRPGDRVLLLAPPEHQHGPSAVLLAAGATDPYAGLTEAVWTITRLGRGTDTATASPAPDYLGDPSGPVGRGVGSGSGPRPGRLGLRTPTDCHPAGAAGPGRVGGRPAGTFDLIITAVDPHATGWLTHTDWDGLLAGTGALAVITHSDKVGGRLHDPIPAIVSTVRNEHRGWLDHIAVLDHPLPPAPRIDSAPASRPAGPVPSAPVAEPLPLCAVHHDLLLFGPVAHDEDPRERAASSDD